MSQRKVKTLASLLNVGISYREPVSLAVDCTVLKLASLTDALADRVLRTDHDFRVQQCFIVNIAYVI